MNNLLKMILIASFSVNVTELPAVGDTKAPAQEAQQKWAALLTKHLEDAKEAARRAINERSKAEILRCIGRIETSLGNVTEAKKTLDAAKVAAADIHGFSTDRIFALLDVVEAEARLGDFKAAEETALGIDPDRWAVDESLLTIAKVHLERGEFQKAQQMTARMKNAFAKAKGYALLASASGHAGERKRGVEQLAIALQFADKLDDESESDVTLGLVAVAQLELNVPDQANRTLQRIRSEDHLAEAIPGIAKALTARGQSWKIENILERLKSAEAKAKGYALLADAQAKMGLRTETRQSLQRAIRFANTTTNDTTRTFEIIAIVHARLDDTMSAKKIVAERLRGDYNRSEAYARIAEFESQKGGCSEAIETFNRIPFDQPMAKGKALAAVAESTVLTDKPPVMARDADKIKTLADEGRPIPERQASLEAFATQLGLPDDIAFFHLGAARGIARLMGHKDLVAE